MSRASGWCVGAVMIVSAGCGGDGARCAEAPASSAVASVGASPSASPSASVGTISFDFPRAGDFGAPPLVPPPNLPNARTDDGVVMLTSIMITADQSIFLQGERVAFDTLTSKAKLLKQADPDVRVVISADRDVKYARVIEIMDALRQAGIVRIAFAVSAEGP